MWEDLEALVRFFGDADAVRVAEVADRSVDEIDALADGTERRRVVHAARVT